MTDDNLVVASQGTLEGALAALADAPWIALDTEFVRERTYYPQLCLLQLAGPNASFCIDALANVDLGGVCEFLATGPQTKIVHAARQDLEALARVGRADLRPLFDTQLAAALLGYPEQVAYAWLVEAYTGITLDKSQTRTDWAQRPLTSQQVAYAEADVRYLGELYRELDERLAVQGKRDWLAEEAERLIDSVRAAEAPDEAWRRCRGIANLASTAAPYARHLCAWREQLAQRLDRPRGWLLKDETLLALAVQRPRDLAALSRVPGVSPGVLRRDGQALLACLRAEVEMSRDGPLPGARLSMAGQQLLTDLQALTKARAAELNVAPGLLASRRDLEALLAGEPSRFTTGWRAAAVGDALLERVATVPPAQRYAVR